MLSRSSAIHLTLAVPGLGRALEVGIGGEWRLPRLERLIARARAEGDAAFSYEALLFALLGLGRAEARDIPLAAVMYPWDKGESIPALGWWLRADPVYLHPDRDRLVLYGPGYLGLNEAERQSLSQTLTPLFTEYGWRFEAVRPDRWYLCLPQAEAVNFTALGAVEGKYIGPHLPAGPKAGAWRTLFNEIQMSLHDCPANREREKRGVWPVNSLWFWGAGEMPASPSPRWRQVSWVEDEPLLPALAAYCGVPATPAAPTAEQWLAQNPAPGRHLLVLNSLAQTTGPLQYQERLTALENDWFSGLYGALRRRALATLTLYPLNNRRYHLPWLRAWHWWRRPRSLSSVGDGE